jgi:hypothetical protein
MRSVDKGIAVAAQAVEALLIATDPENIHLLMHSVGSLSLTWSSACHWIICIDPDIKATQERGDVGMS